MRVLAVRDSEQVLPVDESSEIGACGLGINLEVRGHELRGDDRVLLRVAEDLQRLISLVPFLLPCLDDLFGGFDREAVQFPFAVVGKERDLSFGDVASGDGERGLVGFAGPAKDQDGVG